MLQHEYLSSPWAFFYSRKRAPHTLEFIIPKDTYFVLLVVRGEKSDEKLKVRAPTRSAERERTYRQIRQHRDLLSRL